jgi:hypothetical protein
MNNRMTHLSFLPAPFPVCLEKRAPTRDIRIYPADDAGQRSKHGKLV